jgi:hypothetical protein
VLYILIYPAGNLPTYLYVECYAVSALLQVLYSTYVELVRELTPCIRILDGAFPQQKGNRTYAYVDM